MSGASFENTEVFAPQAHWACMTGRRSVRCLSRSARALMATAPSVSGVTIHSVGRWVAESVSS